MTEARKIVRELAEHGVYVYDLDVEGRETQYQRALGDLRRQETRERIAARHRFEAVAKKERDLSLLRSLVEHGTLGQRAAALKRLRGEEGPQGVAHIVTLACVLPGVGKVSRGSIVEVCGPCPSRHLKPIEEITNADGMSVSLFVLARGPY